MAQGIGGYYKGDRVETHSLSKDVFNGLLCSVVDFKDSDGRVVVELPKGARDSTSEAMPETMNVKPVNLKLDQAGEKRTEAERLAKEQEERRQPEGYPADNTRKNEEEGQQEGATLRKKDEERQQEEAETLKPEVEQRPQQEDSKPQASDGVTCAADSTPLVVGDTVELHSLSSASLNGERGKVVRLPDDQSDRVLVDLGKLGSKAFKPANVKLKEATPEELMWKACLAALQKVAFVQLPTGWDPKPVLMAVVSALAPCGDPKTRKPRIGDIVMTIPVERRISSELEDQSLTHAEVMAGLEKKHPNWSVERRQDHWDRLEKKDSKLEAMQRSSTQDPSILGSEGKTQDDRAWTLERCECARVVALNENGDFCLENPRGVVSEPTTCSRFGFVGVNELSKSGGGYVLANQPNLLPIKCRVRTFALTAEENNGLEGVVENFYKEKGRYEVKFGEKSLALKSSNLLQLCDVKLTTGNDSVDASVINFDAAHLDFALCVKGELRRAQFKEFVLNEAAYVDGFFRDGSRIIVHSLTAEAAKQWNECMGEVVGYNKETQRYLIQVSPTAQLKIKPDNVRYCPL